MMSIFQSQVTYNKKGFLDKPMNYDSQLFFCPSIYAKDGFHVSLQVNSGNYCSSENGYRVFGHTMQDVEFGFPSEEEEMFVPYAEDPTKLTNTVGNIPISVVEEIFTKHGGIDWEKTINIDSFKKFTRI
jgi:hypothetical protein